MTTSLVTKTTRRFALLLLGHIEDGEAPGAPAAHRPARQHDRHPGVAPALEERRLAPADELPGRHDAGPGGRGDGGRAGGFVAINHC